MPDIRVKDILLEPTLENLQRANAIILGIPTDEGIIRNGGRTGAALAPDTIRKYLHKLTPNYPPSSTSFDFLLIADAGNIKGDDLEALHASAKEKVANYVRNGKTIIALGGGHDVTYPLASGFYEGIGKTDFSLINIDAHLDVREKKNGLHHSGSSFRLLIEDGVLLGKNFTEFGIQPFSYSSGHLAWAEDQGASIRHFDNELSQNAVNEFQSLLDSIRTPLYVTFDIDAIRASDAPGCSAPSPIGFNAEDAIAMCYAVGRKECVSMLDIVEVNPLHDLDDRTSRLAARMIAAFFAGIANRS